MTGGWRYASFTERTGLDLRTEWRADLDALVACGWGVEEPERFRLTPAGLRFADAAAARLLRSDPTP
jgi:coproporphyrinogen III oxidase-like Fe-S oxidoreductase